MYNNNRGNNNTRYRNNGRRSNSKVQTNIYYDYKGAPKSEGSVNDLISRKALKDMPHSSYSLKANPFDAQLPNSQRYPILNAFNRVIGGKFSGLDNIDGGNVQQYASSSLSKFLKCFDEVRLKINANYRLLPISPQEGSIYAGKGLIDVMRQSISESVSLLQSTTFTTLGINSYAVVTDLPMGSASTENIGTADEPINAYTDIADVIYSMSMVYQLLLQNPLSVFNWHNSFRLKQGTALRNAWEREVPQLNNFFGLMNKKSFVNLLETLSLSFEGEYVDKDWMEQINAASLIPSRRSNSMFDPVLELQIGYNHPNTFKVYLTDAAGKAVSTTPFFDMSNLAATVDGDNVDFWDICDNLRDYLSLEATQAWARSIYVASDNISESGNNRFNKIVAYFSALTKFFSVIKPAFQDLRECYDTMARTGVLRWAKGFRPGVISKNDCEMPYNLLIDNIYQLILSGNDTIEYNDKTYRWVTYSLWNMYSGIPEYDAKSGGIFLSLACKNIPSDATLQQVEYLPILFQPVKQGSLGMFCYALSRDGAIANITYTKTRFQDNAVMRRLAPLPSQNGLYVRIPTVSADDNPGLDEVHYSMLYKMLTTVFGSCRVQISPSGTYDTALDPDILSIYQIEIEDPSNMASAYARANAPFRGTADSTPYIGFTI